MFFGWQHRHCWCAQFQPANRFPSENNTNRIMALQSWQSTSGVPKPGGNLIHLFLHYFEQIKYFWGSLSVTVFKYSHPLTEVGWRGLSLWGSVAIQPKAFADLLLWNRGSALEGAAISSFCVSLLNSDLSEFSRGWHRRVERSNSVQ